MIRIIIHFHENMNFVKSGVTALLSKNCCMWLVVVSVVMVVTKKKSVGTQ